MKRIFCILLAMFLICSPLAVSAEDSTGLLAELEGATVGGKTFNFADYPKVSGGEAQLLAFMEKGYSFDGNQSNYAMMVYVYNPSETAIVESGKNKITLATKFDTNGVAEDYETFSLQFIDKTDNNRFYKFQVIDHVSVHDGEKIVQRVDKAGRRYTVSEIELQYVGNADPNSLNIGKSFVFMGYQAEKNLSVKTSLVEMIGFKTQQTYWRSETSSLGVGHRNQLNSVYFAVPNTYFEKNGVLQKIKAEWNEQKTSPVVVVDNKTVCDGLYSQIGEEVVSGDSLRYGFYQKVPAVVTTLYRYVYNVDEKFQNMTVMDVLGYAFFDDKITTGDIGVTGEQLRDHIVEKDYADWLFGDVTEEGRVQGQQVQVISDDELLNLETFGKTHDWFTTFWNFGIKGVDAYEEFANIPPIYLVQARDVASTKTNEEISELLYVAETDVDDVRAAYEEAAANDCQLVMFRFAVTDYFAEDLTHFFVDDKKVDCNGYIFEETVFLDFNVIFLSFCKDGVSTVIPVASASIDHVSDGESPNVPDGLFGDDKPDWSWIKTLVSLLAFLFLVVILMNPAMIGIESIGGIVTNSVDSIRTTVRRWTDKGGKK